MVSSFALFVAIAFSGLSLVFMECDPKGETKTPGMEWKVKFSDVVAYGQVKTINNGNVTFELRCIFKGPRLPEIIRIYRVGYNQDKCINTELAEGEKYLVYLSKMDNDAYVQEFKEDSDTTQMLDEVTVVCGTSVSYPKGYDETNNKEVCPEENTDECVPLPTPATPSTNDESTPLLEDISKDDPNTDGGLNKIPGENTGMVKDDNGSTTLTLHLSTLVFLILLTIKLL